MMDFSQEFTLDDPLSFDFFGFDFDFKEYDSDELDKMSGTASTPQTFDESLQNENVSINDDTEDIDNDDMYPCRENASTTNGDTGAAHTADSTMNSSPPSVSTDSNKLSGKVRTAEETFGPKAATLSTPVIKRKKTLAAVKRKAQAAKKSTKKLPDPILPLDVRRTLPKLLLNTFNSCDLRRVEEMLEKHCTDDIVALHRYEGIKNPYGRNFTRLKGKQLISGLWQMLFKSAPDFFFLPLETRAFYDPEYRVVVACQFTWSGTRVMDIRFAELSNESVLKEKLANPTRYLTDEQQLLQQLIAERQTNQTLSANTASSSFTSSSSSNNYSHQSVAANVNVSATGNKEASNSRSLFYEPGELIIEASETRQNPAAFSLEKTPMAQKLEMSCKGTFIVYLNDENRIYKYEFVYIAMHEAEAMGRVVHENSSVVVPSASDAAHSSATTSTTSNNATESFSSSTASASEDNK